MFPERIFESEIHPHLHIQNLKEKKMKTILFRIMQVSIIMTLFFLFTSGYKVIEQVSFKAGALPLAAAVTAGVLAWICYDKWNKTS